MAALAFASCSHGGDAGAVPAWLETDSARAIHARLLSDFPWTVDEALDVFAETYPGMTAQRMDSLINLKYIETLVIDDTLRVHRKAPRNLALLDPAMSGETGRGFDADEQRIAQIDSALAYARGENPVGGAHRVTYRFTISVPYHAELAGDTLHAWLPLPLPDSTVAYQGEPQIIDASAAYSRSPEDAVHSSIYMSAPAPAAPGDTAVFTYTGSFVTRSQYVDPEFIAANIKPYDTSSALYKKYTAFDSPHIVRMDSIARAIVGDETDPARCSDLVFDYIQRNYPWTGAREYSTIPCIPRYVLDSGHGDCGQVSLLYISLMRSLGIPARWVSGWMLHPGKVNFHDWAGVYYEGVGWVPVDVSFGYAMNAADPAARTFYAHGMDSYRMSVNQGIGGQFFPAKNYVRSETVDFQAGEVECSRGNLFYPAWKYSLDIISMTPVDENN